MQKLRHGTVIQYRPQLCDRCSKIDLTAVFAKRPNGRRDELLYKLGPLSTWSIESCTLCHIMSKTMNLKSPSDHPQKTELWSYTSDRLANTIWIRNKTWTIHDVVALKIEHSLAPQSDDEYYLFSQNEENVPIQPVSAFVDFDIVKSWMTFCQKRHIVTCGKDAQSLGFVRMKLPSFKVIDCEARQIIRAPDKSEHYVALSYTWGTSTDDGESFHGSLPDRLPITIENALEVTLKLGFKYLWIDRYCIDQRDEKVKREQVYKMDLIYNQAWMTIIAAAGKDPTHGLPGVGQNARAVHSHVSIGGHILAQTLGNPMKETLSSVWFQRGWTFQEGLLSRRRLVFTDHQAYFECAGMYCCENQNIPLDQLHLPDGHQFEEKYCNDSYIGIFPRRLGAKEWEIVEKIEIYSTRQLSRAKDKLNGFLGILRSFENGPVGLRHCHGVPIFSNRPADVPVTFPDEGRYPTIAGFGVGLCWYLKTPSERRTMFPSWSWTGWLSEPLWKGSEYWWSFSHGDSDVQIQFQLHDGQTLPWEDFRQYSYDEVGPNLSNILHISAWVSPMDIRPLIYWSDHSRYYDGVSIRIEALRLSDSPLLGVHLLHAWKSDWAPAMTNMMVIQEVEPGVYERVGAGSITQPRLDNDIATSWMSFKLR